jgi:hypothetical protein
MKCNITVRHNALGCSRLEHHKGDICIVPANVLKVEYFVRFVAFLAIEYDKVLLGYHPGQMVEQ